MTYVSCSPYMVPVAWLAAAQAEIKWPGEVQPKASRADRKRSHVSSRKRGKKR
jgi:hypothetical protein